jgi:hypothetical protein
MPHLWKDKEKTQLSYRPDSKPGIIWGQELGDPECPYMKRWVLNFGKFAIRLHHWIGSDDPRNMHDHAWGFWTFVIKGGYSDVTECRNCLGIQPESCMFNCNNGRLEEHLGRWSLKYRPPNHKHTVQTDPSGAWTILLNGPHVRKWGFWVDGKFMKVRRYFDKFGHHPCIDDENIH